MKHAPRVFDLLIPVCFAASLVWFAPLATAFQFGGDEGYELMKGFLCSRGHPLYVAIWNDQPPLHTAILAALFRLFGPSAFAGRLLAVGFATLLMAALYGLVRQRSGRVAALIAVLALASSPMFLQLSVSVMIELPAMALALAGTLALFAYFKEERMFWLVLSGMILACALQTKLTAIIFYPALLVEWAVGAYSKRRRKPLRAPDSGWNPNPFNALLIWLAIVAATFVFIALLFPGESIDLLWRSHSLAEAKLEIDGPDRYAFDNLVLLRDYDALAPALLGVLILLLRRRWDLLFPAVLLATAYSIHLFHRPYWYYYYLHFSIPMAWLAAVCVRELFAVLWRFDLADLKRPPFKPVWVSFLWSASVALIVAGLPERFSRGFAQISYADDARENPIVRQMEEYRGPTHWVFTDRVIYAFHARLPVPPELAVIPSKRIWSGSIAADGILRKLIEYHPEQIVLFGSKARDPGIEEFIAKHYAGVGTEGSHRQFVAKRFIAGSAQSGPFRSKSAGQDESVSRGNE